MSIWEKIYSRIGWINKPSTQTPINDVNLNKMDNAINTLDDRVIELNTIKADTSVVNQSVKDFAIDEETGIITVTWQNGTVKTYDTNIEKIAVNFRYDPAAQKLILTLIDGTTVEVDLSALITQYEFISGDTIAFEISVNGEISATIKKGSITDDMIESNYLAKVTLQATNAQSNAQQAQQSANDAAYDAKLAQSYSVGGSGIRENEDTDNSKYYKEECQKALSQMQDVQVTGVKGENETEYRKGNVNITAENIGLGNVKTDVEALTAEIGLKADKTDLNDYQKKETAINTGNIASQTVTRAYYSDRSYKMNITEAGWAKSYIDSDVRPMYNPNNGLISFLNHLRLEEGAEVLYPPIIVNRAYEDQNGNNILNTYMPKSNIRTASALAHTNYGINGGNVPTMDFLSWWNGAHDVNGNSNLRRCAYGDIIGSNNIGNYISSGTAKALSYTYSAVPGEQRYSGFMYYVRIGNIIIATLSNVVASTSTTGQIKLAGGLPAAIEGQRAVVSADTYSAWLWINNYGELYVSGAESRTLNGQIIYVAA